MRLAIVEDDILTRELLLLLLGRDAMVEAVEAYACAEEALERLDEFDPEVLLLDLGLPGMSGIELIRRVKESWPVIKIVVNTISEDRSAVINAIKAGASGYILKGSDTQELRESLDTLYGGGASMSPRIARMLMLELQNALQVGYTPLTHGESFIIQEIAQGLSIHELAHHFHITPHDVHIHIKNIYEKFQTQTDWNTLENCRKNILI